MQVSEGPLMRLRLVRRKGVGWFFMRDGWFCWEVFTFEEYILEVEVILEDF